MKTFSGIVICTLLVFCVALAKKYDDVERCDKYRGVYVRNTCYQDQGTEEIHKYFDNREAAHANAN